jgi:hypothetical protein
MIGGMLLIIPYTGWLGAQLVLIFIIELVLEKRKWPHSLAAGIAATILFCTIFALSRQLADLPTYSFETLYQSVWMRL